MLSGDCNACINGKMPSYSATCVECGLSRKNYKPTTNADRIRAMSDEELAEWLAHYTSWTDFGEKMAKERWLIYLKQEAGE